MKGYVNSSGDQESSYGNAPDARSAPEIPDGVHSLALKRQASRRAANAAPSRESVKCS